MADNHAGQHNASVLALSTAAARSYAAARLNMQSSTPSAEATAACCTTHNGQSCIMQDKGLPGAGQPTGKGSNIHAD